MKKVFFIVAAATLFFSCAKEMELVSDDTASSGFTFKASIENLATKADMDDSYTLNWAPNDYIGVYVNNDSWGEKNQAFHNDVVGGGAQFVWECGEFKETTANAAFFPWDGQYKGGDTDHNNVNGTDAWFHLRSEYSDYTSAKMLTPLVAKFSYAGDHYPAIEFKHAAAAVRLNVTNLPKGSTSIKMTADKNISGWYSFDLNGLDNNPITGCLSGSGEGDNKTITLNYAEQTLDSDVPFSFIFPVPAIATPKLAFEIKDKNGIVVWSKSLKAQSCDLGRGNVLVFNAPTIVPYEKFNTVSEEWTVIGTANETSWDADFQMVTDGSLCIAKGLTFAADGKFKVRKNGNWDDGVYPGKNDDETWNIWEGEGVYDIIFDISSHNIRAVKSGDCPYPTTAYAEANHHTSIKNAVDLGATETANCYVITAPGKYKIPAVKGNSSTSVGTMAKTKLLWETYNNDKYVTANSVIAAVDWDVDDDYVYFKTPETLKPGNAGIAALDADGNILWSWHIWVPETALTDVGDRSVSKMYYMDRNLGALVATQATEATVNAQSFGMIYQWGRKDPFPGARAFNSSERARTEGVFRFDQEQGRTDDTSFDLAASYAHPMVFAKNNAWRDGVEQWNPDGDKSIDDPCPAGYKVPDYDSSDMLWGSVQKASSFEASSTYGWWKVGQFVFPLSSSCSSGSSMSTDYINSRLFSNDWYTSSYPQHAYAQYLYISSGSWGHDGSTRKRYASSVRCEKINGFVPVFSPEEKAAAEDKSETASANCYVVPAVSSNASKMFKFKTVKGNSSESVGSAVSASVIWETWNNGSSVTAKSVIDAVEYYDGYVYFRMPATPHAGNALIAVKDSNGTILWSWHIWVPATDVVPIDNGIHTKPMMDRNLGALTVAVASADAKIDVTSMGMWYQWGRKDPFPGPQSISTEGAYSDFAKVAGTSPSAQKIQISIAESIKNPTLFARGKYEIVNEKETLTNNDWNSTADGTLWGDNTSKSIYDPCPVGYRVPNRDKNTPLWKDDLTTATGWGYNETNYWFTLGNPASVFPCAGYCDGGSAKVTFRTVLWNAHHDSGGSADTAYNIYVYLSSGNPKSANYGHGKARGYYVRCCAE